PIVRITPPRRVEPVRRVVARYLDRGSSAAPLWRRKAPPEPAWEPRGIGIGGGAQAGRRPPAPQSVCRGTHGRRRTIVLLVHSHAVQRSRCVIASRLCVFPL